MDKNIGHARRKSEHLVKWSSYVGQHLFGLPFVINLLAGEYIEVIYGRVN